jgi:hypothetical protein
MGQEIRPIDLQAANFFKVVALAVTLNEYYEYTKEDLINIEVENYGLIMRKADRNTKRKMERDFPKFVNSLKKDYNKLTKILDNLEKTFEKNYDKEAVQVFIDALHEKMNEIEVEVTK